MKRAWYATLTLMVALAGCKAAHAPTDSKSDAGDAAVAIDDSGADAKDSGSDPGIEDAGADKDGAVAIDHDASVDGDAAIAPMLLTNPWIAFTVIDSGGFGQLSFVKANGTGLLTYDNNAYETDPSWSPNGKKLAFAQYEPGIGNSLHVLDFDTKVDAQLSNDFLQLSRPRWSPDGKTIVVAGTTDSVSIASLFRIDVSSGEIEQITEPANGDGGHDFAPDGTLYFVRRLDAMSFDIFTVAYKADPTIEPIRLTTGSEVVGGVSVHADGKKILYARATEDSSDLIELTLATNKERKIGQPGDSEPRSFVDSDKLVLSRGTFDADSEIAVVDGNGKLIKRCTKNTSFDRAPAAAPVESEVVDVSGF